MSEIIKSERPKVPLALAASMLEEACEMIDGGADPRGAIQTVFHDSKLALADAVDRRIAFKTWLDGRIEAARKARAEWDEQVQRLKDLDEAFKRNTQEVVEAHPDIPFAGSLGKICVQKSPPAVETSFGDKKLDAATIDMFGISARFVRTKIEHSLDAAAVKAAIEAGESVPWATLVQRNHVRFKK